MADRKWFADQLAGRRVDDADRPDRRGLHDRRLGAAGPRHPRLADLATTSRDEGFGFLTCREITRRRHHRCWPRGSPTSASSAGSSTSRWATPPRCGTRCSRPAPRTAPCPVGIGVYGTTGRIEKGYRAFGAELDGERTHRRGRHAAAQGQGRGLRRQGGLPRAARRRRPQTVLCTLTVDDHTSASRREALHARRRADPDPRRRHAHRRARPPPLRHQRRLGALAGQARAAGLPPAGARRVVGNELAVSYMEELYPVTVGSVDSTPLLDPTNERIRWMSQRPGLHQAGPRPRRRDRADRRRDGGRRLARSGTPSARTRSAPSSWPSRSPRPPAARRPC